MNFFKNQLVAIVFLLFGCHISSAQIIETGIMYAKIADNKKVQIYELIDEESISFFAGSFINDTTRIKYSVFLDNASACKGRIMAEILSNESALIKDSMTFSSLHFKNVFTSLNEESICLNENVLTHIIFYSKNLPRRAMKIVREIENAKKENIIKYNLLLVDINL